MSRWLHGPTEDQRVGLAARVLLGVGAVGLLIIWRAIPSRRPPTERSRPGRPKRPRLRAVGNLLLALGALLFILSGVAYYLQMFSPGMVLPRPVALAGGGDAVFLETSPTPTETLTAVPTAPPTSTVRPTRTPTATPEPSPTVTPTPFPPGRPARLTIPSIGVDSPVQEAGTYWENGALYYQTVPYAVAHYRMTAQAGAIGNAVFSGHVTSRSAGNVFADLYKVKLGDEVHIFTDQHEFVYVVDAIREVLPTDVGVMATTPDATITLITCSGQWIPAKREFDHRLIVSAKLKR